MLTPTGDVRGGCHGRAARASSSVTRPTRPGRRRSIAAWTGCRRSSRPSRCPRPRRRSASPGGRAPAGCGRRATSRPPRPSDSTADALGAAATLVQFSTAYCSRCPSTARQLAAIAADYAGVRHVEVDLTGRPDLADRFHVLQTPTTLILDARGAATARIGGVPRAHDRARPPRHPHREVPCHVLNPPASTRADRASPRRSPRSLLLVIAVLGFGGAALAAWVLLAARQRRVRLERDRRRAAQPVRPGCSRGSCARASRRPTSSRTRARRPSRRASASP